MEKLEEFIGPGTAGMAQRIPSYDMKDSLEDHYSSGLEIVRQNRILTCSHNQF